MTAEVYFPCVLPGQHTKNVFILYTWCSLVLLPFVCCGWRRLGGKVGIWADLVEVVEHICTYNTIQYNTIQYNTIQYNTIQYNTIQYNTEGAEALWNVYLSVYLPAFVPLSVALLLFL